MWSTDSKKNGTSLVCGVCAGCSVAVYACACQIGVRIQEGCVTMLAFRALHRIRATASNFSRSDTCKNLEDVADANMKKGEGSCSVLSVRSVPASPSRSASVHMLTPAWDGGKIPDQRCSCLGQTVFNVSMNTNACVRFGPFVGQTRTARSYNAFQPNHRTKEACMLASSRRLAVCMHAHY
jgi:hypothetical protein